MNIYSGFKNEETFRKNLISNIKKINYEDLKDKVCSRLEYAFSYYDIIRLAESYKKGDKDLNRKIEYILEDCNFHYESGLLVEGQEDKLIEENKREIENILETELVNIFKKEYEEDTIYNGMLPANSDKLKEWSINEINYLIDKGILQKRNCEGLAYEFTDKYISKMEQEERENEENTL